MFLCTKKKGSLAKDVGKELVQEEMMHVCVYVVIYLAGHLLANAGLEDDHPVSTVIRSAGSSRMERK